MGWDITCGAGKLQRVAPSSDATRESEANSQQSLKLRTCFRFCGFEKPWADDIRQGTEGTGIVPGARVNAWLKDNAGTFPGDDDFDPINFSGRERKCRTATVVEVNPTCVLLR